MEFITDNLAILIGIVLFLVGMSYRYIKKAPFNIETLVFLIVWSFATPYALYYMAGCIDVFFNKGIFFKFDINSIKIPALMGSLILAVVSIHQFIKNIKQ